MGVLGVNSGKQELAGVNARKINNRIKGKYTGGKESK
jgi:hypothetical protein